MSLKAWRPSAATGARRAALISVSIALSQTPVKLHVHRQGVEGAI